MGRWAARLESWHAPVRACAEVLHVARDRSTLPIRQASCSYSILDFSMSVKEAFHEQY